MNFFLKDNTQLKKHILDTDQHINNIILPIVKKYFEGHKIIKPIVFDIGSNVGSLEKTFSQEIDNCMFYAFEPLEKYFFIAKERNIQNNNAYFYNIGLSDSEEKIIIFETDEFTGCHSAYMTTGANINFNEDMLADAKILGCDPTGGYPRIKPVKTNMTTLDSFVDKQKIKKIDFLKIDVEGMEHKVIFGAKETIKKFKPLIHMEVGWGGLHPDWQQQVQAFEFLFENGYKRIDYKKIQDDKRTVDIFIEPDDK